MTWQPSKFLSAINYGPMEQAGYVYRGLGLFLSDTSLNGRRPSCWALTHLGSGHLVVKIIGRVADVFPIASEIAECGEWDFDGLYGWRNRDPNLPEKVNNIIAKYPAKQFRHSNLVASETVAIEIARARA